jgi:hypothetical protein
MRPTSNRRRTPRQVGLEEGWRSGLEEKVAAELDAQKVRYEFETVVVEYLKPARKAKYTPDFTLPNGIIIETKGRFVTADRQKHLQVKDQHPDLDIRFVFSNPNTRISKQSQTTYAMWCQKNGFLYAKGSIPREWIEEPAEPKRIAALKKLPVKGTKQ